MNLKSVGGQLGTHLPQAEDVLRWVGLQQRRTATDVSLAMLSAFTLGAVVGGAMALLFAPRSGRELRRELGERLGDTTDMVKDRLTAHEGHATNSAQQARTIG